VLIRLGCPESAVTLHIYRVGWFVPIRSQNPYKYYVTRQLLIQIGRFRPVWPRCRSFGRHNFLIRTPNLTLHFDHLDEIYTIVQSNWQLDKATQIWLVYMTGSFEFSEPRYLPILDVNNDNIYIARYNLTFQSPQGRNNACRASHLVLTGSRIFLLY